MPIRFFKQSIAILATTSDTDGSVGAVEIAGPRGSVPPLHVHTARTKRSTSSMVTTACSIGDDVIAASPGTWVWGPRGVPHGYQVHSDRGRHLSLVMPGGFEAFFEEVAAIATPDADPRSEMGRLSAIAARYGVELLGPLPPT